MSGLNAGSISEASARTGQSCAELPAVAQVGACAGGPGEGDAEGTEVPLRIKGI